MYSVLPVVKPTEQPSCSFCHKSKEASKRLIASPSHKTYICDECVLDPNRLRLLPQKAEADPELDFASLRSRLRAMFRSFILPTQTEFECSYCKSKAGPVECYTFAFENETQAQICKDCLQVCRQIIGDEGV